MSPPRALALCLPSLLALLAAGAQLGEVCGPAGPDGIQCDGSAPSGSYLACKHRNGSEPLYGVETGFCATISALDKPCDPSALSFCQDTYSFPSSTGFGPSIRLACVAGYCKRDPVRKVGDFCGEEVGGGCEREDECEREKGELSCELVYGYPGEAKHCVTKDIEVGGGCVTGIGTPVNTKVFQECVEGASCTYMGRFRLGVCEEIAS